MNSRYSAIIVAAGTGRRMNSPEKKQYMKIAGYPVLYHTLKAFEKSRIDEMIIVTGEDELEYVKNDIVEKYGLKKVLVICPGGKERYDSVYEGLKAVEDIAAERYDKQVEGKNIHKYVLIHDGVRPLITTELINSCIDKVTEFGAVIPGVPEKDTVKEVDPNMDVAGTPDRKKIYRVQTPQCFEFDLIMGAFKKLYQEKNISGNVSDITDDAMLVEKYTGHKVKIIDGDYRNIKLTTPDDIGLAEFFLCK